MRAINQKATAIFFRLIENLKEQGESTRFDKHNYWPECNGGIMAVHVERVMDIYNNPAYSIAHYFKQNGDLMSDPEMVFVVVGGKVYPASFTQHSLGIFQESMFWTETGWKVRVSLQRDHAIFAGTWMENIKNQQELKPMQPRQYTFFQDPGHGWLEVPLADLKALGIDKDITAYSYQHNNKAYLEEDLDAGVFIKTAKKANWLIDIKAQHQENTPIRNYRHYQA